MKVLIALSLLVALSLGHPSVELRAEYYPSAPRNFSIDPNFRIVGGHNAERGQFPYQASLQMRSSATRYSHICGGSIISKNWILSAAHCTQSAASSYRVVVGVILQTDQNIPGQQIIAVRQIINHPGYPGGVQVSADDVCLIRLSKPLSFTANVQPIAIPPQGAKYQGSSTLSGWGLTVSGGNIPNHLQYAILPLVEEYKCERILRALLGSNSPFSPNLNVCSGIRLGGESACSGDSGGPLEHNGRVVGIVSWVLMPCGAWDAPSVYAKTSAYSNWIVQQTKGEVRPR
ncbi:unnamed protein product [Ceutorhynchus assimilis]|uniref:Peptidase S1 domain-containing protein n=1 Tax=Ceutorhynchus assimilis TaxID=467358 RepID=A0A9P0DCU9_9CUCU|nr:unnamed protein product [Ceutorhynchus assimilis]